MCMCMYMYMCTYMYVCIYIYISVCVCVCIWICIRDIRYWWMFRIWLCGSDVLLAPCELTFVYDQYRREIFHLCCSS